MSENNIEKRPLVSIVVITYNSENYILETLESIKAQSYKNLELIVTDDASTDDTREICGNWINNNEGCFIRSELVISKENTGIPKNCNRGLKKTKGKWLKIIAGDDAMKINAIEDVIKEVNKNPSMNVLLTQVETFNETFKKECSLGISPHGIKVLNEKFTLSEQIEWLLMGNFFPAPGIFLKRNVIEELNGYDEQYRYIEDIPFYLKMLRNGYKIYFREIPCVNYRKHSSNITQVNKLVLPVYFNEYHKILLKESVKFNNKPIIINNFWQRVMVLVIFKLGNKGLICQFFNKLRINFQPRRFFRLVGLMN